MSLSFFSLRFRVYTFFFITLMISLANFGSIIYLENKSLENYEWVKHTHEVIELNGNLLAHLIDAETGQRGYILTGQLEYLEPYYSGITKSIQRLEELKRKTQDNFSQQDRFLTVEQLIDTKFAELKNTIELKRIGQSDDAIKIVVGNEGKLLMDDIRRYLDQINLEEKRLLFERQQKLTSVKETIRQVFIVESIFFILIFVLLGWLVNRSIISPIDKLYKSARAFELGMKYVPVDIDSKDEIGSLAKTYNSMLLKTVKEVDHLSDSAQKAELDKEKAVLQSLVDPLTELFNRRYMEIELPKLISFSRRYEQDLSIIILDIDHFKSINDEFGHITGDSVLITIGQLLKREVRGSDFAIRYGGEEFILALSVTSLTGAESKAESLRQLIAETEIPELGGRSVTVSLGISQLTESDESMLPLILRADEALYQAKNAGRNCWRIA